MNEKKSERETLKLSEAYTNVLLDQISVKLDNLFLEPNLPKRHFWLSIRTNATLELLTLNKRNIGFFIRKQFLSN